MATAEQKRDELRGLMKGIDIAMFTTLGEDGYPVSRPLSTQEAEFDGKLLWFFVRRSSAKVQEIQRYPRVNVAYSSKDKNVYLSVAGLAEVVDDPIKIDEFWNDAMKAFFAKGPNDPNLVLIRVTVKTVEYWSGPSTAIGKAIAFVIARITKDDDAMGTTHLLRFQRDGSVRSQKVTTQRPARSKPASRGRAGKKASSKKPASKKAAGKRLAAGRSKGTSSAAKKSVADKSARKNPASKKSVAKKKVRAR